MPIYVSSPATFGPGSYLEFVGEALDTLYTNLGCSRSSLSAESVLFQGLVRSDLKTPPVWGRWVLSGSLFGGLASYRFSMEFVAAYGQVSTLTDQRQPSFAPFE